MKTALDTNIVSGLIAETPTTELIETRLRIYQAEGSLIISAIVYAELLAHPRASTEFVNDLLERTGIHADFDIDRLTWAEAGKRFSQYSVRRFKATRELPRRLIADFVIGAHAIKHADRLMTFDRTVNMKDFPELLLVPEPSQ